MCSKSTTILFSGRFYQHSVFKKFVMPEKNYRPISCDFHSELELCALRHKPVEICYRNEDETEATVTAQIADLYTRNGEEFLLLPNSQKIRLDRLVSVDMLELAGYRC